MRTGKEIRWVLKGQSPESIRMVRLAEYMQHLSALLGQEAHIRFLRVEKSSTALITQTVGDASAGQMTRRAAAAQRGYGAQEAVRAYRRLDEMVYEDRGTARLVQGSATIIHFPGRGPSEDETIRLLDHGELTGKLYALYEQAKTDLISARIRPHGGAKAVLCTADHAVGLNLRQHLFEAVRIFGKGTWTRSQDGIWTCEGMHIERVRAVENVSLCQAIDELRAFDVDWPDDPLGELVDKI